MKITKSVELRDAIEDALHFLVDIPLLDTLPTIEDIQKRQNAMLERSVVDVQTEVISNEHPANSLKYYLDIFRYQIHLCDASGKVDTAHIYSPESIRDRLERENQEPGFVDFYCGQCAKLLEIAVTRIEEIYKIMYDTDWEQVRRHFRGDAVPYTKRLLELFDGRNDVLECFLKNVEKIDGVRANAAIVAEIHSVENAGFLPNLDDNHEAIRKELEDIGIKVGSASAWYRAIYRKDHNRSRNVEYLKFKN